MRAGCARARVAIRRAAALFICCARGAQRLGVYLDAPLAELIAAARRLVDLAAALPPPVPIVAGAVALDVATGELSWPGGSAVLAPTQAALAAALLRRPGGVVPREQLLRAMGYRPGTRTRALDSAVSRLRRRLPGTITAEPGYGYRWLPPERG